VGAALSVGLAYSVQSVIQLLQMRMITGGWNYRFEAFLPMAWAGLGAALALPALFLLPGSGDGQAWFSRVVALMLFLLGYLPGVWFAWKRHYGTNAH
jgi:hypothetical protein